MSGLKRFEAVICNDLSGNIHEMVLASEADAVEAEREANALLAAKYREALERFEYVECTCDEDDETCTDKCSACYREDALSLTPTDAMERVAKMQAVVEAARLVCGGWVGQHEMGERWQDEAKDVEALSEALAELDKE